MKCKTCPADAVYKAACYCRKCYNRRRYFDKRVRQIEREQERRNIIPRVWI